MKLIIIIEIFMMRFVILTLLLIPVEFVSAQPGTDIWLFKVEMKNNKPVFAEGKNITSREGYDNQPFFSGDSRSIYFTSKRDSSQTDIYRYDIVSGSTSEITFTAKTSEYSPAITPAGNLSVLMVEEDGTQRIWEFALNDNDPPRRLFASHDSIGYYYWLDGNTVSAFLLGGQKNPNRFSILKGDGTEEIIDTAIGRGFFRESIYLKVAADSGFIVYRRNTKNAKLKAHVKTPGKSQDFALYGDDMVMGDGSKLYYTSVSRKLKYFVRNIKDFRLLTDLSSFGINGITRIAVSRDRQWVAIVAADQ